MQEGDELELERHEGADQEPWRVPLDAAAQREAARQLTAGAAPPLFISLIHVPTERVRSS